MDIASIPVALAAVGGLSVNVLNLLELQQVPKERRPDFKDWLYWLPFAVWPAIGAVLAFLYSNDQAPLGRIVAFHVGLSAPLILRTMASVVPTQAKAQLPPGA